ncbi:MAG TPA: hypothetical protein DIS90_08225 [Cytophagales bacterium]|nr:hypothetical protein [Cytophagales bacterium]
MYNNQINIGFTGGGFISFPLKNNYSFISEFGFSRKGKKLQFNNNEWTNTAVFNFIDLSMALRKSYNFQLRPDIQSNLFFNIGPNIEYWISGKGKMGAGGEPTHYDIAFNQVPDANFNINYYNNINRWLFGIDFGFGMDAPITPTQKLLIELRFTFGQTNLGKENSTSTIEILGFQDDLKMNIKTLSVTAGYSFGFDLKKSKMGKSTKDKIIKRKKR